MCMCGEVEMVAVNVVDGMPEGHPYVMRGLVVRYLVRSFGVYFSSQTL